MIPTIITQIAAGAKRIQLGALRPTRDFNYVADIVRGFEAVACADACVGQVTNVGSGYEISIGDLAGAIAEVMGASVEIVQDEQRLRPEKSEVERLLAGNAKARELAGWTPEFSGPEGLREGLRRTVEWFLDPGNLRRYKADRYNI